MLSRFFRTNFLSRILPVFFIVMTCFAVSCHHKKEAKNDSPLTLARMLLEWHPDPNHVPYFAGLELGIFAQHGIDLQLLVPAEPGDILPFVATGKAELGSYYTPYTLMEAEKGASIKVIGRVVSEPLCCVLFRKDSKITSYSDLQGKVVGYPFMSGAIGPGRACIDMLESQGIVFGQLRKVAFDIASVLGAGQADAIWGAFWNLDGPQVDSLGVETGFLKWTDFGMPVHDELIIIASDELIEKDPSFAERFKKALGESIAFAKEHPDEAFALYLQANPNKGKQTQEWEKKAWEMTVPVLTNTQEPNRAEWEAFYHWMHLHGLVEGTLNLDHLVL